ncbi:hypothetical protein PR048_014119 [Dryococelus australis]|uniref:Uncharacterized protein n=1 Tax=Dryococelus australis TaxID=614101 RepID=A0ABQ9HDA1_9NEOP|nr:hypothetical protein PR048_014119 [Dryococelus australis]
MKRRRDPRENSPTNGRSSGTIPICEKPMTRRGIEPGSPWWEESVLIAQPAAPILDRLDFKNMYVCTTFVTGLQFVRTRPGGLWTNRKLQKKMTGTITSNQVKKENGPLLLQKPIYKQRFRGFYDGGRDSDTLRSTQPEAAGVIIAMNDYASHVLGVSYQRITLPSAIISLGLSVGTLLKKHAREHTTPVHIIVSSLCTYTHRLLSYLHRLLVSFPHLTQPLSISLLLPYNFVIRPQTVKPDQNMLGPITKAGRPQSFEFYLVSKSFREISLPLLPYHILDAYNPQYSDWHFSTILKEDGLSRGSGDIWAALNNEVLRADEGEARLEWRNAGMKGRGKREIPVITRRPAASSGTIPSCENPGATPQGMEPSLPSWEASSLTTTPPIPGLHYAMPGLHYAMPGLHYAIPGLHYAIPGLHYAMPGKTAVFECVSLLSCPVMRSKECLIWSREAGQGFRELACQPPPPRRLREVEF